MNERTWMQELAGGGHIEPVACTFDGAEWDVVTDGRGMLMLQGATYERTHKSPGFALYAERILSTRASREATTELERLRQWALAAGPLVGPCETCNGGTHAGDFACIRCSGSGRRSCGTCGHGEPCLACILGRVPTCPTCSGAAQNVERAPVVGMLLGVFVDRLMLQLWLEHVSAELVTVQASGAFEPIRILGGPEWQLILAAQDFKGNVELADKFDFAAPAKSKRSRRKATAAGVAA